MNHESVATFQVPRLSTRMQRCVRSVRPTITVWLALSAGSTYGQSVQTDWSGGPGQPGPVTQWADRFQGADNVAWRSVSGQVALASMPLATPQMHTIAGNAEHPKSVAVGDIDGDGVNDMVSPDAVTDIANNLGAVYWWRRDNDGAWVRHVVDEDFYGAWYVSTADVDGDGDVDVIASAYFGIDPDSPDGLGRNGRFAWFENLAGDGSQWTQHVVGTLFWGARYVAAGDLDGDGDIDLAGASELTRGVFEQDADIVWFENADGGGETWEQHALENDAGHGWEVHIADIDGDGAMDIVSCEDGRVAWFDNANGDGSLWLKRIVGADLNGATFADVGDIDSDGDLDVVGGSYHTVQIGWWDNTAGSGSVWFPRYVVNATGSRGIDLGDVDGDGDLDALIATGAGGVWWIEHVTGDGVVWNPQLVSLGFQDSVFSTLGDADSDGKLDAVCSDEDFAGNDTRQLTWFDLTQFVQDADLISSILDGGDDPGWGVMTWDAEVPVDASLSVQVRASDDPFNLGPFVTVGESGLPVSDVIDASARYLQYRLLLDTEHLSFSPIVRELSISKRAAGDADGDGDVDLSDFAVFDECVSGPNAPPKPPPPMTAQQCLNSFDFDLDEDVDFPDFAEFSRIFTGD